MKNFFPTKLKINQFSFSDIDTKHLKQVLRVKLNTTITCVYLDHKYLCTITSLDPLIATINEELFVNDFELKKHQLTLFQAVIKPKHFEWILSKANELNLSEFYPTIFARSQGNLKFKHDRLTSITESAAKQSGRVKLCSIHETINFSTMLELIVNYDLVLVPYETKENILLGDYLNKVSLDRILKVAIIVGPEGGFSSQEIEELQNYKNVQLVTLTKTVLRSETASLYTLAVLIDKILISEKGEDNVK